MSKFDELKDCKPYLCFASCIVLTEFACFICVCVLCGLSKKNPFEIYTIEELSLYFNDVENKTSNITNIIEIANNSEQKEFNNFNINKKMQIFNKNKKDYSMKDNIKTKIYKRKLVSKVFCSEIRNDFEKNKGEKLSNIFDLNYEKIRNLSIPNMIVTCVILSYIILDIIMDCIKKKINKYILTILYLIIVLSYIARFVLSIILFYYIEKGDIEKYDSFKK